MAGLIFQHGEATGQPLPRGGPLTKQAGAIFPPLPTVPQHANAPVPGGYSHTGVSPLLLGTNMALFDGQDQVVNSPATRALLQSMPMRIIRMPTRRHLPDNVIVRAAQAIKEIGAIPLVILQGRDITPDALSYDTRIIRSMNTLFGDQIVYYEYGNEEDLLGVPVERYTSSWNYLIPQFKRIARNARFIGPVNFQYDRNYLQAFLQEAQPRPDMVSWHEYTCDAEWEPERCMSALDNWRKHIANARAVMTDIYGVSLPIMITEWNYAPNASSDDGKNDDPAFMNAWTSKALRVLAESSIFASMQYSCTNTAINLIDGNNTLTEQGKTIKEMYRKLIIEGEN